MLIALPLHKVAGGIRRSERDGFRIYDTHAASADDYGRFFATNHQFKEAFRNCDDPDHFSYHVGISGYASDPDYEAKLKSIMAANGLKDFDHIADAAKSYTDALSIAAAAIDQSPWKHLVDRADSRRKTPRDADNCISGGHENCLAAVRLGCPFARSRLLRDKGANSGDSTCSGATSHAAAPLD